MSSFIQFALATFLVVPFVVVALIVARKAGFSSNVASIGLLPVCVVLAFIVFHDDGSLGFIGYGGLAFALLSGLRGVFELLRELKRRASQGPMSLLDERERR